MVSSGQASFDDVILLWPGFRSTEGGAIGVRNGLPVEITQPRESELNYIKVLRVVVGTSSPAASDAALKALRAHKKDLPKVLTSKAVPGGVQISLPRKLVKRPEGAESVDAVLGAILTVPGVAPTPQPGADLYSVDGVPMLLTGSEREAIHTQAKVAAESYEALPSRLGAGLAAGAVGALLMAGAWGALAAYANLQAWVVAIGGGLLVAFLAVKFGGKVTLPLRIGIFVLILVGVLLGEVLGVALYVLKEEGVFDLGFAFDAYFSYVQTNTGELYFPLAGALIGGYFGIRVASKPKFERSVEAR